MGKKNKGKGKGKGKGRGKHQAIPAPGPGRAGGTVASSDGRLIPATELAARLAGLSTVLQRQLAHRDAGDGLTRARLSALALLVLGGPRTLGELAAAERVRPPTMTRLVHAMEADGLVARDSNPTDRRSVIVSATPLGESLLEDGRASQIGPLADRIALLDGEERALLQRSSDLLGRLLRDRDRTSVDPDRSVRDARVD